MWNVEVQEQETGIVQIINQGNNLVFCYFNLKWIGQMVSCIYTQVRIEIPMNT